MATAAADKAEAAKVDYVRGGANVSANQDVSQGSVSTSDNSQTQISVGKGTVRMGSKTEVFIQENQNQLDLKRGVMLVSSNPGVFRKLLS